MLIDYEKYTELGYNKIDKANFNRYSIMAEQKVHLVTSNRINQENISETNIYGICEIINLLYDNENSPPVASFSNARYSESYIEPKSTQTLIDDITRIYFTAEQLYRGVKYAWS